MTVSHSQEMAKRLSNIKNTSAELSKLGVLL